MSVFIVFIFNVKGICPQEHALHLFIMKRNLQRINASHILKLTDHRRHIMSKYIQFQKIFIDGMVVKMRRNGFSRCVIRRMLNGTEFIDFMPSGNYDDSSRMLACCSSDSCATLGQSFNLPLVNSLLPVFKIFHDKAKGCFSSYSSYCSRPEIVFLAKNFFHIFMGDTLILSSKIKIYIRFLVPFKPKKYFKRNIKSILLHQFSAFRAILSGHVHATVKFIVVSPLKMLAFFTDIMWCKRVHLCDPIHGCGKGRTY